MIEYLIYVLIGQGIFYLAYKFWFEHPSNYHWNRLWLLLGILLPFVLPALQGSSLSNMAANEGIVLQLPAIEVGIEQVESSYGGSFTSIPLVIWMAGTLIAFLLLSYQIYSIFKIIRSSPKRKYGKYTLISVPDHIPTCSILKYILWPENQPIDDSNRAMLEHELAHVKEWHTLDIFFLGILKCLLWLNPFLYLYEKELRTQHEFSADRYALSKMDSDQYIRLLAQSVLSQANLVYAHSFSSSNLKSRINMIKSWNNTPVSWKKIFSGVAFVALLGAGMACTESAISDDEEAIDNSIAKVTDQAVVEKVRNTASTPSALPQGGMQELYTALGKQLKYPKEAIDAGIEGKVLVSFVIGKDGSMGDFKVVKGIGHGCDEAAVAALEKCGILWDIPSKDGKVVSQNMMLPISFKI